MTDPLAGRRVLILGLARQGTALARWLCSIGARVTVSDLRSEAELAGELDDLEGLPITFVLGEHPLYLLNSTDLLCISGGVPTSIPIVQAARERNIRVSNDAQLFMERCPCHVIGITGSSGKTTTTALVGGIFERTNTLPWVGGNIGNPLIEDLPHIRPDDIVVMELSSFQLEIMTASPHVAAVLNITPNHLDRHGTMDAYVEAKAHILDNQLAGDIAVLNRDDPQSYALRHRAEQAVAYFSGNVPVEVGAWLVGDRIVCRPTFTQPMDTVCTVDEIPLRGFHNVLNVLAACAITGSAGVLLETMREGILAFEPVPHRLEVVREWGGVTFINDSIATAPERVVAALNAFQGEGIVLLLGGQDKKLPWAELIELAVERCHAIIGFGEIGRMVVEKAAAERALLGANTRIEQVTTLDEAVMTAVQLARDEDIVLLSPGGTSYDAYTDFEERGEHFRALVERL
jgi:UDP-N-acetylmuramoylalanine--D-glutamate ligase